MSTEVIYRCKNTGGPDGDCEYAASNETIPGSTVTINDNGDAICPGETVFGEPCGSILEEVIPPKNIPWPLLGGVVAGLAIISGLVWFLFLRGDALIRVDQTVLTLGPGQSAKVEIVNDGEVPLQLNELIFSDDRFSAEEFDDGLEIEPGSVGFVRVKFTENARDTVQGTMTIDSNSSGEQFIIELIGNPNPWSVAEKLNNQSTILDKE